MRRALLVMLLVCLASASARGQAIMPPGPFQGFKSNDKDPVEINADYMQVEFGIKKLHFTGHVKAKQGDRIIYADRMDVDYTDDGKITYLEAIGNVKVVMDDAFATTGKLTMDNRTRVIELLDEPRVVQGKQIIVGRKITYYMEKESLLVDRPRIEWMPEQEDETKGQAGSKGASESGREKTSGPEKVEIEKSAEKPEEKSGGEKAAPNDEGAAP